MTNLDPAAIMDEHEAHHAASTGECCGCLGLYQDHRDRSTRCEMYRLAEAVAAERARVGDAWDEGYRNGYSIGGWDSSTALTCWENPYRATLAGESPLEGPPEAAGCDLRAYQPPRVHLDYDAIHDHVADQEDE